MCFSFPTLILPQPTPATTMNVPEDIPAIRQALDLGPASLNPTPLPAMR